MHPSSTRPWRVVTLFVYCLTAGAIHAADGDDPSGTPPSLEPEFGNILPEPEPEPEVSAAELCYRAAVEGGRELFACDQAVDETSVFDDQGQIAALTNRALILSNTGDFESALLDIERALDILPGIPGIPGLPGLQGTEPLLINRGNLLWRMRRYEEALESYQNAIDASGGTSALAFYNRVFVHRARGDIDLAMRDLETARRLANSGQRPATDRLDPLFDALFDERTIDR